MNVHRCDTCREPITFGASSVQLFLEEEDEETVQYDFCSFQCLKHWVIDE
jgi:hypothetical protein